MITLSLYLLSDQINELVTENEFHTVHIFISLHVIFLPGNKEKSEINLQVSKV